MISSVMETMRQFNKIVRKSVQAVSASSREYEQEKYRELILNKSKPEPHLGHFVDLVF